MEIINREVQGLLERVVEDNSTVCDSLLVSAERIHRLIVLLIDAFPILENCLPLIVRVVNTLSEINDNYSTVAESQSDKCNLCRPRIIISRSVLEHLIGHGFKVSVISQSTTPKFVWFISEGYVFHH